jgi:serine protease AprX
MFAPLFFARLLALGLFIAAAFPGGAQADRLKVWIVLADKGPAVVASGQAFEDAPVHAPYLTQLRAAGVEIAVVLKWQNRVSGWVEASGLGAIGSLAFVRRVEEMPRKAPDAELAAPNYGSQGAASAKAAAAPQDFGAFNTLFNLVGASALRDTVARRALKPGEGVKIAIMDADFRLGHTAFDSLFARGAILDQYDFVSDTAVAVSRAFGNSHGGQVLSQIGGELPGVLQGLAPHARFLLYRTEDEVNEYYAEEDFLAAALERAVDSGAQVINISLGYRYDFDTQPDVPYASMNGRTRPSSIAAVAAARRGALVVVAIGNEGLARGGQPTVTAPSDADSILAVGAVSTAGVRCSYSSTGPTPDARRKPEVSSIGCSMPQANTSTAAGVFNQGGTSFAAPVVAGIAALLRQLHPDSTGVHAQQIRAALMSTASRDSAPDNLVGHGIVNAAKAHCTLAFSGPCRLEPDPSALKNMYVWRGGYTTEFAWPSTLSPDKVRAWDMQGRSVKLQGRWNADGKVELNTQSRRAPAPLILKIPVE